MNFIKTFESFHLKEIQKVIDNKETYLYKKIRPLYISDDSEYDALMTSIRNYDINNFSYEQKTYGIFIEVDKNFDTLYQKLCNITKTEYKHLIFNISLTTNRNLIDFENGVPELLQGTSIAYKIYKMIIKNNDFISSNKYSSNAAYNLWYNLVMDSSLYAATSKTTSFLIYKNIDDDKLKNILNIFKNDNLIYDQELKEKIIEIYGTLDIS
jgi:hypothetical protein